MKKLFIAFFFLGSQTAFSQTTKKIMSFSSINSIGAVWGNNQNIICLQTINGISYKTWNYGVGISFDSYGSQSTPVFIDVRKSFGNKQSAFAYVDAGINIPWRTNNFPKKYSWNNADAYTLKTTGYGEIGIGLNRSIANNTFFTVSIGYSYKTFSYTQHNAWVWSPSNPTNTANIDYDYYYKRIALRLGISF